MGLEAYILLLHPKGSPYVLLSDSAFGELVSNTFLGLTDCIWMTF